MLHMDMEIDARGLHCPLPILRAKKALSTMQSGQLLRVIATDAGAAQDFPTFAQQTGNTLRDQGQDENGVFFFVLQRR